MFCCLINQGILSMLLSQPFLFYFFYYQGIGLIGWRLLDPTIQRRLFWLSVNWTFSRFEINYLERRKVHAKKASQLHTRGEGCYPQASPGRAGSGLRPVRSV